MSAPIAPSALPAQRHARAVAWWLTACAVMIFGMVVLGGATRLTKSGLSMVEWKPLTVLPPLSAADWQSEFANYQHSPQFTKLNGWMTVDDFKGIYWLEYTHRLWGRVIGLVFAVPLLWFIARRAIGQPLAWKLAGIFALGGLQGALGWFMVASGLEDRPAVSQYRLAAHLVTAFIVYALVVWVARDQFAQSRGEARVVPSLALSRLTAAVPVLALIVAAAGAFVANLHAGEIYNTFPLMDGQLVPDGLMDLRPWYLNFFENILTVQFDHRVLAMTLVAGIAVTWWLGQRDTLSARGRSLLHALLGMALIQATLGIATLLLVVPVPLALVHQSGALVLFTLAVCLAYETRAGASVAYRAPLLDLKPAE